MRKIIFALCFVSGVALILYQRQIFEFVSRSRDDRVLLATVSKVEAQGEIRNSDQKITTVEVGSPIRDQDTVQTQGLLRVKFADGMEVEFTQGTSAFFENSEKGIFVTLRSGNFTGISRGGGKEKVLFIKDGLVLDPLGRNIIQPPLTIHAPKEIETTSPGPISEETLTDTQISNSMAGQRQSLLRCYANNLKSNPKSKGEIYLSFTIQKNGETGAVRVLQDSFDDAQLIKCVSEVIERVRFDSFTGDPIVVNYPIFFE